MTSATSSNYLHNAQMTQLLHGATFPSITDFWVALFTTVPALAGTGGVEVSTSGTAYARVRLLRQSGTGTGGDAGVSGWTATGSGTNLEYSNTADLIYPVPTANWGTIVGAGIFDASTGGNLLYVSTLSSSRVVNNGDGAPRILAGQLRISRAVC